MSRFSWRWWPRSKKNPRTMRSFRPDDLKAGIGVNCSRPFRRWPAGGALAATSQLAEAKDSSDLPPPKRALTGRNEAGKSVFKSFDVTSKVVEIDSNPGLTFYELYMTEGVPRLTGLEPDPMLKGTKDFPGPGGTMFRLISYPPKRPEGYKPPPGVTFESALEGIVGKGPRHGRPFRTRRSGHAHNGHHRLWGRGSWRDDAGIGRRTEGPFAPGRLHRAKRNPPSLAQPVAGALSHGLRLGWRQARLGLGRLHASWPGLTRPSIFFGRSLVKMDGCAGQARA